MTTCSLLLSSSRYFLNDLEYKLSMMLNTGLNNIFVRYVMFYLNVAIVEVSVKSFTGVSNISFNGQSYTTKISVFPSIDMIDNLPVKSTYRVPFFGLRVAWYAKR